MEAELFMLPTLRTDDKEPDGERMRSGERRGKSRKFQFIKLLSIRTSSYLRPSYLLFNHSHIFLPSRIDLSFFFRSLSLSRARARARAVVRARTHSLLPVCFIVFPSCCTHKARTLPRSHGDVVMLVGRMRNAPVYIERTHTHVRE